MLNGLRVYRIAAIIRFGLFPLLSQFGLAIYIAEFVLAVSRSRLVLGGIYMKGWREDHHLIRRVRVVVGCSVLVRLICAQVHAPRLRR